MKVKKEDVFELMLLIESAYSLALAEGPDELVDALLPIYDKSQRIEIVCTLGDITP